MRSFAIICLLLMLSPIIIEAEITPQLTDLWVSGYAVFPTPRNVELKGGEISFDGDWKLKLDGISKKDIAVTFMESDLDMFYHSKLKGKGRSIHLSVKPGAIKTDDEEGIDAQAYRLVISPDKISIVGNSRVGLFYGVQTFLQLIKDNGRGGLVLPECTITDWPTLELRIQHWDNLGHQDRIKTLKHLLDWAARFKVNAIGWEITDKFYYPSRPIIGIPGALTSEQVQEVIDYGLERHIQIMPQVQAPTHMKYVLKHPEFAHLRADGMLYQACLCDERSYELIFDMYEDLINATQGVDYFFASTDEVYDPGICEKCTRRPLNATNRSLYWVEFVNRAHDFLTKHNRKMLCWMEYPLLTEHLKLIPPDIIDGVLAEIGTTGLTPMSEEFIKEQNRLGIRQLIYISMEGVEKIFPNLFPYVEDGRPFNGRLQQAFEAFQAGKRAWLGNPIGSFTANWDAVGVHNEAYILGWAIGAQYSWTPGTPSIEQSAAEFMRIYYGPRVTGMVEIYRGLQEGARFFEKSWDRIPSRERPKSYYDWQRYDNFLTIPKLPSLPDLMVKSTYRERYAENLSRAKELVRKNDQLIYKINENIPLTRNPHSLQVFLALADYERHHLRLLLGLEKVEELFEQSHLAHNDGEVARAIQHLKDAHIEIGSIIQDRKATYDALKATYEISRYPKGQSVDGKHFVHILCNVTDAWNARRPDLSFFTMAEESLELEKYQQELGEIIKQYAMANNLE